MRRARGKGLGWAILLFALPLDALAKSAPLFDPAGLDACREIALSPAEHALILRGKIVLRDLPDPGRKGRTFEAIGLLPGSLDEAVAVLTDFGSFPKYMPNVEALKIREVIGSSSVVDTTLSLPLGNRKRYRLRYTSAQEGSGFILRWEKLPWPELEPSQTIADTSGFWFIRQFEDRGLLVVYHVYSDPGHVPLGLTGFFHGIAKGKIPDAIVKLRERILLLYGPGRSTARPPG